MHHGPSSELFTSPSFQPPAPPHPPLRLTPPPTSVRLRFLQGAWSVPTYSARTPAVRPHACPPPTASAIFLTAIVVTWAEGDDGGSAVTGFTVRPTGGGEAEQVRMLQSACPRRRGVPRAHTRTCEFSLLQADVDFDSGRTVGRLADGPTVLLRCSCLSLFAHAVVAKRGGEPTHLPVEVVALRRAAARFSRSEEGAG